MYFVVNSDGKFWTGLGWTQQGKPFLTVGAATRSLCEEGEDLEGTLIMEVPRDPA